MNNEAQKIPQSLKRYGFEYVLIMKDQSKALYSQYFDGKKVGYEVLMLKNKKRFSPSSYPKHEDFGTKAWAFRTEQAAIDFFQNLNPSCHGQTELPF